MYEDSKIQFEERFKELKKKHGLTNEKIAEYLNCSTQVVAKWRNEKMPNVYQLVALCKIFGTTLDYLVGID
jgi:transcriptional regulator with XRE-family HTH domain